LSGILGQTCIFFSCLLSHSQKKVHPETPSYTEILIPLFPACALPRFALKLTFVMETTSQTFARKKPEQLVYLELGSGNGGMLLSISNEGFRFRSVSPIRSDGLVPFAFSLDGSLRLQGIGEIEWLERDSKSGGMRFADVSAEFRAAVNKWLATDSQGPSSGREVTPAAATPLDTMEQIREDLRRGYKSASSGQPHIEPAEHADSERAEMDDVAEELEKEEIEQLPKHKPAPPPPFRKPGSHKPPAARTAPLPPAHPKP